MMTQLKKGVRVELIILKARQFGISTLFCAWIFWWMWRKMNYRAIIAAKAKGTTLQAMSETMNRFYSSLPEGFRPALRAKGADRISKDEMYFNDRKSGLLYIAADIKESGRGDALDAALCTEVASYKRARDFFIGEINPALGRRKDTTKVMESTAQPGYFWESYRLGKERNISIFLPWSVVPELYSRKLIRGSKGNTKVWRDALTGEVVRITNADRKEMEFLSRQHAQINETIGTDLLKPVSEEQMWWWHYHCETECDGDEEYMRQEYPRDDISAFEKSVRGVFKSVLPQVRATVEETLSNDPKWDEALICTLSCADLEDTQRESHRIELEETEAFDFGMNPALVIFQMPKPGYIYTLGADVADEMGVGAEEDDNAFSVIEVYCCNTREQVAEWRGSIDPHEFGDVIAMVGYLYNTALANVEYNNMGVTTIDRLTKYLEYPNRFRWPKFDEAGKLTRKEMWWTDDKTKQLMIGSLRSAIKRELFKVRSPGLQEELTAYQIQGGRYAPGPDAFADRIIAAALAWQAVEQTDYGLDKVMGMAEQDDAAPARIVIEAKHNALEGPPRRLPAALQKDLDENYTQKVEDDYPEIPKDFLTL
jgi:hypothetical protein